MGRDILNTPITNVRPYVIRPLQATDIIFVKVALGNRETMI